jgi:hypothetical protein
MPLTCRFVTPALYRGWQVLSNFAAGKRVEGPFPRPFIRPGLKAASADAFPCLDGRSRPKVVKKKKNSETLQFCHFQLDSFQTRCNLKASVEATHAEGSTIQK